MYACIITKTNDQRVRLQLVQECCQSVLMFSWLSVETDVDIDHLSKSHNAKGQDNIVDLCKI